MVGAGRDLDDPWSSFLYDLLWIKNCFHFQLLVPACVIIAQLFHLPQVVLGPTSKKHVGIALIDYPGDSG